MQKIIGIYSSLSWETLPLDTPPLGICPPPHFRYSTPDTLPRPCEQAHASENITIPDSLVGGKSICRLLMVAVQNYLFI